MRSSLRPQGARPRRSRWGTRSAGAALVATAVAGALLVPIGASEAVAPPKVSEGLACTPAAYHTDTDGTRTATFVLTAKPGRIITPDGNSVAMWGFASGKGAFQYPGPVLCATVGDHVSITVRNQLPEPTSVYLPAISGVHVGADAAAVDVTKNTLIQAADPGKTLTYDFYVPRPGTYLYTSGTNPQVQKLMGLIGALVVRPTGAPGRAYGAGTEFHTVANGDTGNWEFLHMLSELDPNLNHSVELQAKAGTLSATHQATFDMATYEPRYWFINGRSFPDAIQDNYAQSLPGQPYGSLVHIWPNGPNNPRPALIRYVNGGPVSYPFHPHSNHERIIGRDGYPAVNASAADASIDRYGIVVPAGGSVDAEFGWDDSDSQDFSSPDSSTTGIGVPIPNDRDRTDGTYWSGSPFLGGKGVLAVGLESFNECGEYYHVAHSHAIFQATTNGATMGGMLTMIRIDPPADPTSPTAPRASCVANGG